MRAELVLAGALLVAGCAAKPTHPDAFAFAVMGDTQYNAEEERVFEDMLRAVDREDLAFVIHVGDILGAAHTCSDEIYARRRAGYDASAHPFIYVPGDNEWVDCRNRRRGGHDPLERLAKLRSEFFAEGRSLGRRRIDTLAQRHCVERAGDRCTCEALPENRFWSHRGVRFVTLNVAGSQDNRGRERAWDEEARCREEANRQWLEQAVRASERSETRALVIVMHANPWDFGPAPYRALVGRIAEAARRVRKPTLLVHGDTHIQRVDTPFADGFGHPIANLTRLETFGSPFHGWVTVTVDPDDPMVFGFRPRLYKLVAPGG